MSKLTHIDDRGEVRMVDVGEKPSTARRAVAGGEVRMSAEAFAALDSAAKGDVLATARVAGIMAAKQTASLIPLCHAVALSKVEVVIEPDPERRVVRLRAIAEAVDRTGVEMEALTAVSVAALTIYDMLKAVDRSMQIGGIRLEEKTGGESGPFRRPPRVVPKSPPPSLLAPEAEESVAPVVVTAEPAPIESMERVLPDGEALARARGVQELSVDDPELIEFLRRDPIADAYMLGDLDQPYAEHGRWFGLTTRAGKLKAVLLLYNGLSMPAVLTRGEALNVEALIAATQTELPWRFYANIKTQHEAPLRVFYDLHEPKRMLRMGLAKPDYKPVSSTTDVVPVTHRDTGAIMALYTHYPDNWFDPSLLDTGLYCGIRKDGALISVAGLHVHSKKHNVAAIGNIVTHPEHRGQGLASRSVRWLLDALFEQVDHVALNVGVENAAAIACYRKFGFTGWHEFLEGWATARTAAPGT